MERKFHNLVVSKLIFNGSKYKCPYCERISICSNCIINHMKKEHWQILLEELRSKNAERIL